MIYIIIVICLIAGFFIGRWYQHEKDTNPHHFVKDYSWNQDESLIEAIRWLMKKPDATLDQIHHWCCNNSKLHMLWEPWRCNKTVLEHIRKWQEEDRRRIKEGIPV